MRKNIFQVYHPAVIFLYFISVIVFAMCSMNPVYVGISLIIGSCYSVFLKGMRHFVKNAGYYIIVLIVISAANSLFNSRGLTVLFYLGGIPITAEAICYGLCSGGMLVSVLIWFSCYSEIMTSDKFLALFGKVVPTISMMISMILRYIPDTIRKSKEIGISRQALLGGKKLTKKAKVNSMINMTSILMSWSMEESIETADSMRSRGYGTAKRTVYNKYSLNFYDCLALIILIALVVTNGFAIFSKGNNFKFYPFMSGFDLNMLIYIVYGLLLLFPLLLEGKERLSWLRCHL